MSEKKQLTLSGNITSSADIDFAKEEYYVVASSEGKVFYKAKVSKDGSYALMFPSAKKEEVDQVELKILPKSLVSASERITSIEKKISIKSVFENTVSASVNLQISSGLLDLFRRVTKRYRIHGTVYDTVFQTDQDVSAPISINELPGLKIEFFEVDNLYYRVKRLPLRNKQFLGMTYTKPDGSYEFEFDFTYYKSPHVPIISFRPLDKIPDIQASFYQYIEGTWKLIHQEKVDWNIVENFHRDYFIPHEKITGTPDTSGLRPAEGFRFISLGLIPIDNSRFIKGYVTTKTGDPVEGISESPLCGVLRVFGLFALGSGVTKFKVQIAAADENGAVGTWTDIQDPLNNRKWNNSTKTWEVTSLGPDKATGMYTNIDMEPEIDWHEHALKFTWNSANYPNGYYALRVIGYNDNPVPNNLVGTYEMPIVRIDNTLPEIYLEAVSSALGETTDCGYLRLSPPTDLENRWIRFYIRAYDPEGHVLKYQLSGSRGKFAESAGNAINEARTAAYPHWKGTDGKNINFKVSSLPASMAHCPAMAYSFVLYVWSSATNGYGTPEALNRHVSQRTNLVVTEI